MIAFYKYLFYNFFQTCEYKKKCKTFYRPKCRIVPKKKCRSYRTCGLKDGKKCRQEPELKCESASIIKITFMQNVLKMFSLLTETFVQADFDFSSTFKDKLPFTALIAKQCIMFQLRRFYVIYLKVVSSNIHIQPIICQIMHTQ